MLGQHVPGVLNHLPSYLDGGHSDVILQYERVTGMGNTKYGRVELFGVFVTWRSGDCDKSMGLVVHG